MIINQASVQAVYQSFSTIFNEAFEAGETFHERIAMVVPSTTKEMTYAWLGSFPGMREWVGERHIKNLEAHGYTIRNKDWEATVEVDRNDLEDDTYGIYRPMVAEMGRAAAAHPDELVAQVLKAGFDTPCYDGANFFDVHPVGGGTVVNDGGGSGTAWFLLDVGRAIKPLIFQSRRDVEFVRKDRPEDDNVFSRRKLLYGVDRRDNAGYGLWQLAYGSKQALDADHYATARADMMAFADDAGRPLGVRPNLLVVPPSLEGAGRELLLSERTSAGATNPWQGTAELLVVPWL
jgi:phage major head subunit gpT-like protein